MDKAPASGRPLQPQRRGFLALLALAVLSYSLTSTFLLSSNSVQVPLNAATTIAQCRALSLTPGPPKDFYSRTTSDRFVPGTKPTLIRNATVWTGGDDGKEILTAADVLIDKGIIQSVGKVDISRLKLEDYVVVDAKGAWLTPGIVDMHSHLGVGSSPHLSGASDTNSHKGLAQPWLRSLDGLNTHDEAYRLSLSGGVTTANILPGSANAIGGQAFVIKLRPTPERSSNAMLLEPPFTVNGSEVDPFAKPRWRQMKHACGENPSRAYSGTRMDTTWAFRQAYDTARTLRDKQDAYCARALDGDWAGLGEFPNDLQYEALVDVLRGRVKVHNHCYETVDLSNQVRLTQEFKFPIAAFHHAHETYLVPDLLKQAYGHPPAIAMFAAHARYKREAYRGSEFAAKILADNRLDVVMKSDHSVLDSRYLLFEAQQAHYYGLPWNLALASITTTPSRVMGLGHRIGQIAKGFDADVVLWDSHPLHLAATPTQVIVDGIHQFDDPHTSPNKNLGMQKLPETPDFSEEAKLALEYEGLPPLEPKETLVATNKTVVVFTGIGEMYVKRDGHVVELASRFDGPDSVAVVKEGRTVCVGLHDECALWITEEENGSVRYVDLQHGSIWPGLVSYGSALGLTHIPGEASTKDGSTFDPLTGSVPNLVDGTLIRAVDGLLFSSRDALIAYRSGITSAIVAPSGGFLDGLSVAFSTSAPHKLAFGAVLQDIVALHVTISLGGKASVSTQIAALRGLLFGEADVEREVKKGFEGAARGKIPLVVAAESADTIATLVLLKKEIETAKGSTMRLVISGATEAHLLAEELGKENIGVLVRQRPYPSSWEKRRVLPGPPISAKTAISTLLEHNVTVGLMSDDPSLVRNLRFDTTWAAFQWDGAIDRAKSLELATTNVEKLFGLEHSNEDLFASVGPGGGFQSKVAAVISPSRGVVDLF
ncbi:Carbohydrate esterase family 9 protein [Mycena chlorophos]|uniref:Carbohydrate esterase family 9 protein n=1 Tax=Mycena chlorophos TaxID=658473 RepID=A0A8H6TG17_MYCCL|nr:Carbohydrate esterase family 9 protein [Mycena chlorophos]